MINKLMSRLAGLFGGGTSPERTLPNGEWMEGGLYVTAQEDGTYGVLKILKADQHGVHIRLYSNAFQDIPAEIDETSLYIASVDRKPGEHFGIGHMPISNSSFTTWGAIFVQRSTVTGDELEGYEMWREAGGGYF